MAVFRTIISFHYSLELLQSSPSRTLVYTTHSFRIPSSCTIKTKLQNNNFKTRKHPVDRHAKSHTHLRIDKVHNLTPSIDRALVNHDCSCWQDPVGASTKQRLTMRHHYIAIFAAAVAVTAAQPYQRAHRHARAHVARMARPDSASYAPAPVETVIVYELDGRLISEEEARLGIANGTLRWGDDGVLSSSIISPVALPTTPPSSSSEVKEPVQTASATTQFQQLEIQQPTTSTEETSTAVAPASPAVSAPSQAPAAATVPDASPDNPNDLVDEYGDCASCDKPFPNGVIPCSQFPYGYGAMPLNNEGLGGWSGIQDPGYRGSDGFDNIRTVVKDSCSDGSCCTEGTYCSYGCPNPYLKLSFPKKQGKTGQTVGGLYCNDQGMLEMADGSIGKTLCGKGSDKMTVKVQNKLKKSVSICRTDYPGKINFLVAPNMTDPCRY